MPETTSHPRRRGPPFIVPRRRRQFRHHQPNPHHRWRLDLIQSLNSRRVLRSSFAWAGLFGSKGTRVANWSSSVHFVLTLLSSRAQQRSLPENFEEIVDVVCLEPAFLQSSRCANFAEIRYDHYFEILTSIAS